MSTGEHSSWPRLASRGEPAQRAPASLGHELCSHTDTPFPIRVDLRESAADPLCSP